MKGLNLITFIVPRKSRHWTTGLTIMITQHRPTVLHASKLNKVTSNNHIIQSMRSVASLFPGAKNETQ